MFPTLFSIGGIPVSSFGFFLSLGFLLSTLVIWRISRVYDFDEEKTLDLVLLVFFGGLLGARAGFVLLNGTFLGSDFWDGVGRVVFLTRYPGLNFWGGLGGGTAVLWLLSLRMKVNFWQVGDFASVGLVVGIVLGNIGCFLGGCQYGVVSDWPLATAVVGVLGKRLPVSLLESLVLLGLFFYLYREVLRFHFFGKIVALLLIFLGIIKFGSEFFRGDSRPLFYWLSLSHTLSLLMIILGMVVFYQRSKRSLIKDLLFLIKTPFFAKERRLTLSILKKNWYNTIVTWAVKIQKIKETLGKLPGFLKRRLRVKPTPTSTQ